MNKYIAVVFIYYVDILFVHINVSTVTILILLLHSGGWVSGSTQVYLSFRFFL